MYAVPLAIFLLAWRPRTPVYAAIAVTSLLAISS